MITALETYMDAMYVGMQPIPREERLRIVRQTAQRIRERAARLQMSEADLIADMESPQETARKFLSRWQAQRAPAGRTAPQPEAAPDPVKEKAVPERSPALGLGLVKLLLMMILLPVLLPLLLLPVVFVALGVLLPLAGIAGVLLPLLGLPMMGGLFLLGLHMPPLVSLALNILAGVLLFRLGVHVLGRVLPRVRGFRRAL